MGLPSLQDLASLNLFVENKCVSEIKWSGSDMVSKLNLVEDEKNIELFVKFSPELQIFHTPIGDPTLRKLEKFTPIQIRIFAKGLVSSRDPDNKNGFYLNNIHVETRPVNHLSFDDMGVTLGGQIDLQYGIVQDSSSVANIQLGYIQFRVSVNINIPKMVSIASVLFKSSMGIPPVLSPGRDSGTYSTTVSGKIFADGFMRDIEIATDYDSKQQQFYKDTKEYPICDMRLLPENFIPKDSIPYKNILMSTSQSN